MTSTQKARGKLVSARRLVIKIGSRVLADSRGGLDPAVFTETAAAIARLRERGKLAALVSSGAILAGRSRLGLGTRSLNLPQKQAAAAVGQNDLMVMWDQSLARHGLIAGQVLLTAEDLAHRTRFLNSKRTLEALLEMGVTPVINENDTVAVEEIRYGDNDHLATLVAELMNADALIILTDIDGLCEKDPAQEPEAPVLHVVKEHDLELFACAGPSSNGIGSGGMAAKIEAARTAARRGLPTVIANARKPGALDRIMSGEEEGTLFVPEGPALRGRRYWMAFAGGPRGAVSIDEGAKKAVLERKKSLLPSGVIKVTGNFDKGDVVRVVDEKGEELARGLTQYGAADLKKIMGRKSSEIEALLGQKLYDEVIHRDYLVLTGQGK